jgi:hypothetical protein
VRGLVLAAFAVAIATSARPASAQTCQFPAGPVTTIYLPNVTKTLGGETGWTTPFIVQNVDRAQTGMLRIDLYRFSDGALALTREVCAVAPGTSFALSPVNEPSLPHDTQFSAVIRSYVTDAVAVVNQHAIAWGRSQQAASYTGIARGATSVALPNVVKRFFGFATPFVVQNVGATTTTATAAFASFDGSHTAQVSRTLAPGRAAAIDPNAEPALRDATQYAVTITASQPLAVVANTHGFAQVSAAQIAGGAVTYSTTGVSEGSSPVLMPYVVKNVAGAGKGIATIVVQNVGSTPVAPSLLFRPLGSEQPRIFGGPLVPPGRAWAFDPRFTDGDTSKAVCGTAASGGCLADGEYSAVAVADNDAVASVVSIIGIGSQTAEGYAGTLNGGGRVFLPNVTRRFGDLGEWSTPFVVQGNTATTATVSWYRSSDVRPVTTQTLSLGTGMSRLIDPRDVPGLVDGTRYSVVIEGNGSLAAIVLQLSATPPGDGAMIYEGAFR